MRFAPFASLVVRHDYYGGEAPVALLPDPHTARLAARPDLRLRLGPGRAELFAAEDRGGLTALAGAGPLALTVRVLARDPRLLAVTAAVAEARDRVVAIEAAEPGRVQAGEIVGEADLQPLAVGGLVEEGDVVRPPLAIVRLALRPEARDQAFELRFGAVARFWTYHVLGGAADAAYSVEDRAGAVAFRPLGSRTLSNGARAQSFRSEAPIPERARPDRRFQLLAEGPFGPRRVVETLPCPRPGPGSFDLEGGAPGATSDIFVNL